MKMPAPSVVGMIAAVQTSLADRYRLKSRTSRLFLPSRKRTLTAFAEAVAQSEAAGDVQGLVPALCGLARVTAADEPAQAEPSLVNVNTPGDWKDWRCRERDAR